VVVGEEEESQAKKREMMIRLKYGKKNASKQTKRKNNNKKHTAIKRVVDTFFFCLSPFSFFFSLSFFYINNVFFLVCFTRTYIYDSNCPSSMVLKQNFLFFFVSYVKIYLHVLHAIQLPLHTTRIYLFN